MTKLKKIFLGVSLIVLGSVFFAFKTDYFEVAKQLEIYTTLFKELNLYYIDEINPAELTESAINNMLNELDPYTRYYDEQGVEKVKINSSGEYSGIGAQSIFSNEKLLIVEVYEGFSAFDVGLKVGDEIIKIDDIVLDKSANEEVVSLLKGTPGSSVQIKVKRQGKTLDFTVKREKIVVDPVPHYQMIDDEIGYIAFNRFNNKASSSVKKAFVDLKSQGMIKLILDLRGNPGGLLNEAIDITNFFVPKSEEVVITKAKLKKWSETYKTRNEPIDLDIPLVVLINENSASASEIVAGSLQDLDRAVIIGQRSFGKGLVQRYRNLTYGTKLKLTISKYYTPSGRNIQELDYTNRKGKDIPKFSDKKREIFKTKNGRTVLGGGGIMPDIEVKKPQLTDASKALFQSNAIFSYATNFYYKNANIANAESFQFSDSDYQNFIKYLRQNKTSFKTLSEIKFNSAFEFSEKENLSKAINNTYQDLILQLESEKINELGPNKDQIIEHISDEIINRYYFKKGEYQNHIVFNKSISEAIKILNNKNKYNQILKNEYN